VDAEDVEDVDEAEDGGGEADAEEPGDDAAPDASAESGTLIVDHAFGHQSADPHRDGTQESRKVFSAAYDTLTTYTSADVSEPDPGIATSWSSNDDATVWTFELREGVRYSDGTEMTVEDVVFSLNRFKNLEGAFAFFLDGITIEPGDGNSVVLTSEQTNVALPFFVSYPKMAIVPAEQVRAAGGTDAEDAAEVDQAESWFEEQGSVGTGPYAIDVWSTTSQLEFVRNDEYWGEPAAFDRIVLVNSEPQTALLNVQTDRTDLAIDLTVDELGAIDPTGLQVIEDVGPTVFYVFLNLDESASEVSSNADFREAVRYALDYDAIGELFGESPRQACGIVPSMVLGALDESECVTQDLDRARAALERSGLDDPSITMEYISDFVTDGISHGTLSERIQSQLAEVGITVELRSSPLATQLDRYRSNTTPMHFWTVSMRHPDVSSYVVAFSDGGGNAAPAGLTADTLPAAQELADQILSATSDAEREPLVEEWQRVLNEEGPYVTLFQSSRVLVGADDLTGLESHPLYVVDFRNIGRS
jgi:peptide/nickel transport system substrate-binding protein